MSRALVLLWLFASPVLAAAQDSAAAGDLQRGAQVRTRTRFGITTGRLVGVSPTALVLAERGRATTVDRSRLESVQVRVGRRWITLPGDRLPRAWPAPDGRAALPGTLILGAGGLCESFSFRGGRRLVQRMLRYFATSSPNFW